MPDATDLESSARSISQVFAQTSESALPSFLAHWYRCFLGVFQRSSQETTSADRAGNLRKHTLRRFQVRDPGTLSGTASVPACSSVPAVGQLGQLVKAAGTGRGNLWARTTRSRGVDRHHQLRSGSWVVHQQAGRPVSTDRGLGRRSCGLRTHPSAAT